MAAAGGHYVALSQPNKLAIEKEQTERLNEQLQRNLAKNSRAAEIQTKSMNMSMGAADGKHLIQQQAGHPVSKSHFFGEPPSPSKAKLSTFGMS